MPEDKHDYSAYDSLPIPTYEEATSSRPPSSQSRLGPAEISDDAERQGLLIQTRDGPDNGRTEPRCQNGYQAPTVESVRSSLDSLEYLPDATPPSDDEDESLRQDMEQMEVLDPESSSSHAQRRARMRESFSKRISSLTTTLSSIHSRLPTFRLPLPSFTILTSRLPQYPDRYRPSWPIIARLFGLFIIISIVYAFFVIEVYPNRIGLGGQSFDPESVRSFAQGSVKKERISEYLRHITSFDHVAGSEGDLYLARWIEGMFREARMDAVEMEEYGVYLNYPKAEGRRVAIIDPPEKRWVAKLEEESAYKDPTPQQQNTLVWHGHSRAGNVTGPLIYANYGSREDFRRLKDDGIDVKGSIVLVRYYGSQGDRALKVKAAELAGAVGCLVYSDPAEDGFVKGEPWPNGRWRPSDGVQRGAVSLMSWAVGDVLTPGWASVVGADRISKDNNPGLVNIPSLPLAWRDAKVLLQSLKGHGQAVPEEWKGGVPDVEWWSGDHTSPIVQLQNEQDEEERQPIWNVMGTVEGMETKAKKIIVGNHRDAWCFGSADPGSGTAVMLEVMHIISDLVKQGWRPLRSIVFASWDAEEYNLIGSTEFVENHVSDIRANGIAYLNVDVGVSGTDFRAAASPLFEPALIRVLNRVADPAKNATLRELWDNSQSKLEGLGAGSDYVAFQDIAGTSSIDFGFGGDGFPYHSCYETYEWMERFGDPGFEYHALLAQVWVLLILELAQEPIVPFSLNSYAAAVKTYIDDLERYANAGGAPRGDAENGVKFDVSPLRDAAGMFEQNGKVFHAWEDYWYGQVSGWGGFEVGGMALERMVHNNRVADFETHLLDLTAGEGDKEQHGVPGREQFKHIIFGPQAWSGYDEAFFPAIRDAIDLGNWTAAQAQVDKAAKILTDASKKLVD